MFGRTYVPDERDRFYAGSMVHKATYERSKYWPAPFFEGGQDKFSVGVAWYHWWLSNRNKIRPLEQPLTPYDFYRAGTSTEYEGSTIRGGARLLREGKHIQGYYWANETAELANYLLNFGPVVVGSSWYEGMMVPDRETGIITKSGEYQGEHAYVVDGINLRTGIVRIKNAWGKGWGLEGHGYIDLDEFDELFSSPTAEGCLVLGFGKRWEVFSTRKRRRRVRK